MTTTSGSTQNSTSNVGFYEIPPERPMAGGSVNANVDVIGLLSQLVMNPSSSRKAAIIEQLRALQNSGDLDEDIKALLDKVLASGDPANNLKSLWGSEDATISPAAIITKYLAKDGNADARFDPKNAFSLFMFEFAARTANVGGVAFHEYLENGVLNKYGFQDGAVAITHFLCAYGPQANPPISPSELASMIGGGDMSKTPNFKHFVDLLQHAQPNDIDESWVLIAVEFLPKR